MKPGVEQPEHYGAVNHILVIGSFDMYGPEFGLGQGVAVLMGFTSKDHGRMTAIPGREVRGSVDLQFA